MRFNYHSNYKGIALLQTFNLIACYINKPTLKQTKRFFDFMAAAAAVFFSLSYYSCADLILMIIIIIII